MRLLTALTRALSQSQDLLKSVAVCVDELKYQQIKKQDALLEANLNNEVSEVKDTVVIEMKSWSDLVREKLSEICTWSSPGVLVL